MCRLIRQPPGSTATVSHCATCEKPLKTCEGHFGRIRLPVLLYHPMFFKSLLKLVKSSCLECGVLADNPAKTVLFKFQMQAVNEGLPEQIVRDFENIYAKHAKAVKKTKLENVDEEAEDPYTVMVSDFEDFLEDSKLGECGKGRN